MASADFEELAKDFILVKIDLTDRAASNPARALAQQYSVTGIPDIRILSSEGTQIASPDSTKAAIMAEMKKVLGK